MGTCVMIRARDHVMVACDECCDYHERSYLVCCSCRLSSSHFLLKRYNAARRIAYIPFPFPEAQIEVFFSLTVLIVFPFLYSSYVNSLPLACIINFATVICFLGMTEVSRELENPFINVPNDLPLLHFQAQFNEALICMYAGFHPDAWFEETAPLPHSSSSSSLEDDDDE